MSLARCVKGLLCAGLVLATGARAQDFAGASSQTLLWSGPGRIALGVGVEQPWVRPAWTSPPGAAPRVAGGRLLLGLALRTSARSRLVWQLPERDRAARPSLDLRRNDPYRSLLRGTLRFELAPDTALSLRAQGRRLGLTLTRQW